MAAVHVQATQGFSAKAGVYASGRPDYPEAVADWLTKDLALSPGKVVVDLGSGTGKFLPLLKATGSRVIAIEPVAAMRAELVGLHPDVEALEGSADHIPLADQSIDALVCAQSFHWFANAEALAEIRRVLKPGGALGLIWNERDESVSWVAALTAIMQPYVGDTPRQQSREWRRLFPADGFTPLQERVFPHTHTGSPERVIVDRVTSVSYIASLPITEQQRVLAKVRDVIATSPDLAGKTEVTFPYSTTAYSCLKTFSKAVNS